MGYRRGMLVSLLAVASGCSLAVSLDGLSSGAEPADAATTSPDGADAPSSYGSDAASDGPPGNGGGPFCAALPKAPRLCVDFSDGKVFDPTGTATDFDGLTLASGGTAPTLDHVIFTSLPASARFVLGAGAESFLTRTYAGVPIPPQIAFAMSMRIDSAALPAMDLMEIRFGPANPDAALFVTMAAGGALSLVEAYDLNVDGGRKTAEYALGRSLVPGQWTRLEWSLDTGTPAIQIKMDGIVVLNGAIAPATSGNGLVFIAGSTGTLGAATVFVDDVVVDF